MVASLLQGAGADAEIADLVFGLVAEIKLQAGRPAVDLGILDPGAGRDRIADTGNADRMAKGGG